MDINEHPLRRAIYELCLEIEKFPASEQQTKTLIAASDLQEGVTKLLQEKQPVPFQTQHRDPQNLITR